MKKLISIFLILITILCSCSAPKKDDENKKITDSENKNTVVYTLYFESNDTLDSSANTSAEKLFSNDIGLDTESISGKKFTASNFSNVIAPPSNALQSKKMTINGKGYDLDLFKVTASDYAGNKVFADKNIGTAYTYKFTEGEGHISFKENSDIVLQFFDAIASKSDKSESLTETELSEKADTLLKEIYGNDTLKSYTTIDCGKVDEKNFVKLFAKKIHGYETNDTVKFVLNTSGELCLISAENFGVFDDAESEISKADIEAAEKILRESISEDWKLSKTPCIKRDSTGQFFLMLEGTNDKLSGENHWQEFYININ